EPTNILRLSGGLLSQPPGDGRTSVVLALLAGARPAHRLVEQVHEVRLRGRRLLWAGPGLVLRDSLAASAPPHGIVADVLPALPQGCELVGRPALGLQLLQEALQVVSGIRRLSHVVPFSG